MFNVSERNMLRVRGVNVLKVRERPLMTFKASLRKIGKNKKVYFFA